MEEAASIRVEELEIFTRVGVTANERVSPQRLTFTITVWPKEAFENLQDDITRTVNYSAICVAAREFVQEHPVKLIETLATQLASHLLQLFPVRKLEIEVRKFVLPDAKHVSVTVSRSARPD